MLRRTMRSTMLATAFIAVSCIPTTVAAQSYVFSSCDVPGVCGSVEAFFGGGLLNVRVANADNTFGSALYKAQIFFAGPLGTLGDSPSASSNATLGGGASSIGSTPANAWYFSAVGGESVLDLTNFFNVYIEGAAASPFRAMPGDLDNGTWVTDPGYVEFSGDLSGISGVNNGRIVGLGFCTDQDCAVGDAVVTPEPATFGLVAMGLVGLLGVRRRRKSNMI